MNKFIRMVTMILAVGLVSAFVTPASAGDFSMGLALGTQAGFGGHLNGTFKDFTRDLPISARFTYGLHSADPGDPYAARRVFINDNTNGTPDSSASYWQLRFDLGFPVFSLGPQRLFLSVGPRWAKYTAKYNFVGGNEIFEIETSPWGLGVGLQTYFAISDRTEFMVQVGFDQFMKATIEGHDTSYSPDGIEINGRDGYDYNSADDAIGQPKSEVLVMLGLQVRL